MYSLFIADDFAPDGNSICVETGQPQENISPMYHAAMTMTATLTMAVNFLGAFGPNPRRLIFSPMLVLFYVNPSIPENPVKIVP